MFFGTRCIYNYTICIVSMKMFLRNVFSPIEAIKLEYYMEVCIYDRIEVITAKKSINIFSIKAGF